MVKQETVLIYYGVVTTIGYINKVVSVVLAEASSN